MLIGTQGSIVDYIRSVKLEKNNIKTQKLKRLKILHLIWSYMYIVRSGLCSKGARVPQATNFCLWATR